MFTRILRRLALMIAPPLALMLLVACVLAPALPQAGQIAFSGSLGEAETLYLMDVTHDLAHPLARDAFAARLPGWSADGARLAYADSLGSIFNDTIFVHDIAAHDVTPLPERPDGAGQVTEPPVWSPDAQSLVVSFGQSPSVGQGDLQLTRYQVADADVSSLPLPSTRANHHAFRWLPDGRLLFVLVQDDTVRLGEIDLANMSLKTVQSWPFVFTSLWQPVIAPDGSRFVISAIRPDALTSDLYLFARGSAEVVNITQLGNSNETQPVWSADGSKIAYKLLTGTDQSVVIINADGSDQHILYRDPDMRISNISWSPDDTRVSFLLNPVGETHMCIAVLADGDVECPYSARRLSEPVWRP